MTAPVPPSPAEKTYRRVLWLSAFDGWSVIGVAGAGTLLSLAFGGFGGAAIGLLLAGTGVAELHGRRLLLRRDLCGMQWLVRAQLSLLALILVYCVSRLLSFDAELVLGNLTPDMAAALQEAGLSQADIAPLVHLTLVLTYGGVALVSLLYQGGMAFYYRSRTARVAEALAAPPAPPQTPLASG